MMLAHRWVNALSTRPSLEAAVTEVVTQAQVALGATAHLGLVFISDAFASEYPRLLPLLRERLSVDHLIGCGGGGTIGCDALGTAREVEGKPALSLTLAHLPGVRLHSFHLDGESLPDLDASPATWVEQVGVDPAGRPHFVLLGDPGSSSIVDLLQGLDFAYPQSVKVGGLAGGGGLFHQDHIYREGTVGLALTGVRLDAIVAQGCRPIGQPYRVTKGERNVILALEDHTPLRILQDLIQDLDEADRKLAQNSLFIGVVGDAFKQNLVPADFLIRNLIGIDPRQGAIAIGDRVRAGQRIQFHLRDARTSAEDLRTLLEEYVEGQRPAGSKPLGALMFSCLGRGENLYGQADVDSDMFQDYFPQVPLGGFFCNGEIGPVGGTTYLHGYTSVFALVYPE